MQPTLPPSSQVFAPVDAQGLSAPCSHDFTACTRGVSAWHVCTAERSPAAHDAGSVPGWNGAIENAAATLRVKLDPTVVAAGCRSYLRPQAAQLPLVVANWGDVVGDSLEAEVARYAPKRLLVGVELVFGRGTFAVIHGPALKVGAAPQRAAANAGGVVDRALEAREAAAALGRGGEAAVLVPTTGEFQSASQAADLPEAEAAGKIHAVRATATAAAIAAPKGIRQDPLLQGVPRALQLFAFRALAGAAGDVLRHVFLAADARGPLKGRGHGI